MNISTLELAKMDIFRIVRRYLPDELAYSLSQSLQFDKIIHFVAMFKDKITNYSLQFSDCVKTEYLNLKNYLTDLERISNWNERITNSLQPLSN